MEKSVIGASQVPVAMPATTLTRVNAAISNLTNLINTGKFNAASVANLQKKLASAQALQQSLLIPAASPHKAVIGDDSTDDTLDDIENAVQTAATVYQTVTNKPAPVVIVNKTAAAPASPTLVLGMPLPVVLIGGAVATGLLIWALSD